MRLAKLIRHLLKITFITLACHPLSHLRVHFNERILAVFIASAYMLRICVTCKYISSSTVANRFDEIRTE